MFPLRLIFLFLFLVNKNIFRDKLFYFKLKPNYEIFWQSDSDAVNSIDPFICSLYFISNGFKILNYPNIFKSLFIKSDYLLMQSYNILQYSLYEKSFTYRTLSTLFSYGGPTRSISALYESLKNSFNITVLSPNSNLDGSKNLKIQNNSRSIVFTDLIGFLFIE